MKQNSVRKKRKQLKVIERKTQGPEVRHQGDSARTWQWRGHQQHCKGKRESSRRKKQEGQPLVLCLCSVCANQFYDNPAYTIRRLDPEQKEKDTCMYCNVRQGFDYEVRNK